MIRSFEDSWGSFGRFWKLVKSSGYHSRRLGPESPPKPEKGAQLFPSLLVLPSCMGKSKAARRRARRRGRSESWDYAEIMWAYFTFLDGGSPYRASQQQRLLDKAASNPWTSMHSAYAGFLHSEIHRYVRLQSDEPLSRGILKLSELVKVVQNSDYTSNLHTDRLTRVAKNVKPDRMSLPERAGIVEPQAFLKGKHLETFRNMSRTVPHGVEPDHPTVGCYRVEPQDVGEVNRKLLDSGVATLIPEEFAMRDSRGNIISGGLFAVDHKSHSDRIILDRRPFNELERRLVWARLPHGSLLTQLIVPKGFSIRGSGDDLSNYFYLLKHHEDWLPRNTVGKIFDGAGYEKYGGLPGRNYLLSFRVIAMGDLNAVDLAQQVHLEILQDSGCMNPGECIEFKHPLPASHTMEGLYIDDHIITQILPDKHHREKGEKFWDEVLLERSRNQYANQGIPTSQSKKFDKADKFVAWGTELDNKTGRAGAPLIKLKQLSELLVRVTRLRAVSKKMLQGVTGLLVHPFMHRRSMMCLLQETFLWIEKLGDSESKPLPIAVREELCSCALMLPLCHSNIRWPVSCRLGASDASLTHGGRAAALVPPAVAQTLYRFAEHKGEAVRLDWVHGALEPPSTMQEAPEELQELVSNIPWNQTESCSFARRHHINVLETRMIFRELKDLVHKSTQPLRNVLLVDSRAACVAWAKGRSSARSLNRILRQALGWTLVGRKSLHLVWIKSAANPSDFPSRCKRIPEPPKVATPLAQEILGDNLEKYRTRKSNRDIWRAVAKQDAYEPSFAASAEIPNRCGHSREKQESELGGDNSGTGNPAIAKWSFREIFAGTGHLTRVFKQRKKFSVLEPVEIMKHGKIDPNCDILNDVAFNKLCSDACHPHQLWHFGFPCGSFSIMQNMNKGTRTAEQPLGDGTVHRENVGNEILHRTLYLCELLHKHGSFFTLENPLSSFAWKIPRMRKMLDACQCAVADLDQCEYGLKIPDKFGIWGLAKKPTKFLGTMPNIGFLARKCSKQHDHIAVLGGVKVQGKWQKRSQLAGSYPKRLCEAYAKAFEHSFAC